MIVFRNQHPITTQHEISSQAFWRQSPEVRLETFRALRHTEPVSWQAPLEDPELLPEVHLEAGFWAVTRAEDITFVSQNHEIFSSELGSTRLHPTAPDNPYVDRTFINLDPPRHTGYRKVMSAAFTPKAVGRLAEQIEARAADIVDRVVGMGEFDFVAEVSSKLPMLTVADLVGVPEEHVEGFAVAGDEIVAARSLGIVPEGQTYESFAMQRIGFIYQLAAEMAAFRRKTPGNDIMTSLVQAELNGQKLNDNDIGSTLLMLSIAGNDTTKQTTSRTAVQFDRNPEQRAWLLEDFDGRIMSSIEEFVRHASPIVQFSRTATQDTELGGANITAGDKVAMFYASGNYDETVFPDPERFDLQRPRTQHVGFGGGGVHFCLGNGVAKAQLRALFRNITTKLPHLEIGEPENLDSEFINGVIRLPANSH